MTDDDKKEFAKLLTVLQDVYGKEMKQATMRMYWDILKDYPLDDILNAGKHILQNNVYNTIPKPAEFIKYLKPDVEALAFEAFREVEESFTDNGYTSLCFEDPIIHYVIDNLGGWIRICEETASMDDKTYSIWRHGFIARYKAFCDSPPNRPVPRLIGTHEQGNRVNGWLTADNKLILPSGKTKPAGFIAEFIHDKPLLENKKTDTKQLTSIKEIIDERI